jgi:hypothetical protein
MKLSGISVSLALVLFTTTHAATRHYVDLNSSNPTPPYADWSTAATNIQDAVDVAVAGDMVQVASGTYQDRGRLVPGVSGTNRLAVTKALLVSSVDGPATTIIRGYQTPGTINATNSIRCCYLGEGAMLAGFTLTNGATPKFGEGAGVLGSSLNTTVSNCVITGNASYASGGGARNCVLLNCIIATNVAMNFSSGGGGASQCILTNCVLAGNSADKVLNVTGYGGGSSSCTMSGCTLIGNFAAYGGGDNSSILLHCILDGNHALRCGGAANNSTLIDCLIVSNFVSASVSARGGGAYSCTLSNCLVATNAADGGIGGGAYLCVLYNCAIQGNRASSGGGVQYSTIGNCLVTDNSAVNDGGGVGSWSSATDCTIVGNHAIYAGGAIGGGTPETVLNNCLVYFNYAQFDSNFQNGVWNYCCTTPLPTNGVANITNQPAFVDRVAGNFHLQSSSPCINSGANAYVTGNQDLDGNPRISGGTVDIGAYEFQNPASVIAYAWLQQYGLATDGSVDFADSDQDGMNSWQEWIAGTVPTDAQSVLKVLSPVPQNNPPGVLVQWQSVPGKSYSLQRSIDLAAPSGFSTLQSNIIGAIVTTSYLDTNAIGSGPFFYRVGLQP